MTAISDTLILCLTLNSTNQVCAPHYHQNLMMRAAELTSSPTPDYSQDQASGKIPRDNSSTIPFLCRRGDFGADFFRV